MHARTHAHTVARAQAKAQQLSKRNISATMGSVSFVPERGVGASVSVVLETVTKTD